MLDFALDTQTLDHIFTEDVECQTHYLVCDNNAQWAAIGSCPQCLNSPKTKTMCQNCFEEINAGGRMRHDECGYKGLGIDFFDKFRRL